MLKKAAVLVTILILVGLYANIDRQAFVQHFRQINVWLLLAALGLFVPQVMVTSWRWRWMVADILPLGLLEAAQLILAGKALNVLLPSKLGEMSKAYFLKTHSNVELSRGVALVLLEKVLDVSGLCMLLLMGVLWAPEKGAIERIAALGALAGIAMLIGILTFNISRLGNWLPRHRRLVGRVLGLLACWDTTVALWKQDRARLAGIVSLSCCLWVFHLLQIYLFFLALHSAVTMQTVFAYVPISIFIGLLPFTIGGMGTRDSALIFLFAPYESAAVMAGVGLLCSLRYWADTLMGLPFFYRYSVDRTDPAAAVAPAGLWEHE